MSHFFKVALAATLLAAVATTPALAGNHQGKSDKPKSVGELISECMRDIEKGKTAGRMLSAQQRMVAEAQCRARAESEASARNG